MKKHLITAFSDDHRDHDPARRPLSSRDHRRGASSVQRQGQRPDPSSQRPSHRLAHHRPAFHRRPSTSIRAHQPPATGTTPPTPAARTSAPTNQKLIDRVAQDAATLHDENPNAPVPVDMVTYSASGLDPHISPAAAEFQVPRVARARGLSGDALRALVAAHTEGRQFGFFGEPRVNVLELNLALDAAGAGTRAAIH